MKNNKLLCFLGSTIGFFFLALILNLICKINIENVQLLLGTLGTTILCLTIPIIYEIMPKQKNK